MAWLLRLIFSTISCAISSRLVGSGNLKVGAPSCASGTSPPSSRKGVPSIWPQVMKGVSSGATVGSGVGSTSKPRVSCAPDSITLPVMSTRGTAYWFVPLVACLNSGQKKYKNTYRILPVHVLHVYPRALPVDLLAVLAQPFDVLGGRGRHLLWLEQHRVPRLVLPVVDLGWPVPQVV